MAAGRAGPAAGACGARSARIADHGWDEFYDGETAEHQAAGLAAAGSAIDAADLAAHASTWTEPIAVDYRGIRVDDPPAEQLRASWPSRCSNVLEQFEPPAVATFAGGAGADLRWTHLGIEAAKLAMADRDAHLTDPATPRGTARAAARHGLRRRAGGADRPGPGEPAAGRQRAPRRRARSGSGSSTARAMAVSLIESNYMGFGSGVVDPATGIAYQNRGSLLQPRRGPPERPRAGKRTLHTLMPGMLFRDGRPWVVVGSMGGDAQPQIHAQVVSALVDGGVDVATRGRDAALVRRARGALRAARRRSAPSRASGPGCSTSSQAMGHPVTRTAAVRRPSLGHCHAIELVDGGPAEGGSLAAATDPRSAGLPAVW